MKELNKEEYNKMCADFMGMQYADERSFNKEAGTWTHSMRSLDSFHTDWNWIMEVVEKIESTQRSKFSPYTHPAVEVSSLCCSIVFYGNYKQVVAEVIRPTKKEAVVQAVWEFLNWYQQQSKPQTT
jgi:hypothetical protein